MIGANAIAVHRGILPSDARARIDQAIRAWRPTRPPALHPQQILAATEHDKKNTGTARVMVFPRAVGQCVVVGDVTEDEVRFGIDAALAG
jgi:3-dehydroquinate synthetase